MNISRQKIPPGLCKFAFIVVYVKGRLNSFHRLLLSGDLCKSGPGYFASEKSFPSNFAQ